LPAKTPLQIEADWDVPAREWSERMWSPPERPHFEGAFARALADELRTRVGDAADALVHEVERIGSVITAHHVCPTNGPTFGAMDFIASLGQHGPIFVLAWSGVPMSNAAASGALCFDAAHLEDLLQDGSAELRRQLEAARARARDGVSEKRVTLIPPALRDALVYECAMPARVEQVLEGATPSLAALLPRPGASESYAAWALRTNEAISRTAFGRDNLWYVDLNRVAKRYLLAVLTDPQHLMSRLVQHAQAGALHPSLARQPWFYARGGSADRAKVIPIIGTVPDLAERLRSDEICPGLVPVFAALRLLSRIRLLGGVRQLEYLEEIVQGVIEARLIGVDTGISGALLTGRLMTPDQRPLYPLDLALGAVDRSALPDGDVAMGRLWQPLFSRA
jgi:hypothetical protein